MLSILKVSLLAKSMGALFCLAKGAAHSASAKSSPLATTAYSDDVQPESTILELVSYLLFPHSLSCSVAALTTFDEKHHTRCNYSRSNI